MKNNNPATMSNDEKLEATKLLQTMLPGMSNTEIFDQLSALKAGQNKEDLLKAQQAAFKNTHSGTVPKPKD